MQLNWVQSPVLPRKKRKEKGRKEGREGGRRGREGREGRKKGRKKREKRLGLLFQVIPKWTMVTTGKTTKLYTLNECIAHCVDCGLYLNKAGWGGEP
jgi:hypothetical protein